MNQRYDEDQWDGVTIRQHSVKKKTLALLTGILFLISETHGHRKSREKGENGQSFYTPFYPLVPVVKVAFFIGEIGAK